MRNHGWWNDRELSGCLACVEAAISAALSTASIERVISPSAGIEQVPSAGVERALNSPQNAVG